MAELSSFFKSLVEEDNTSIVICDLSHTIIYMNKTAIKNHAKHGGEKLIGTSILDCHNADSQAKIKEVVKWFEASKENNRVHSFFNEKQNKDGYMVALRDMDGKLIGYYEKHEFRTRDGSPFYDMQ